MDNFVRGRSTAEHIDTKVWKIEVSLDDMNPEFYGFLFTELEKLGVNEVYVDQVVMKKSRPGQILNVICQEEIKDQVVEFLFRETTTFGLRYTPYTAHRLERKLIEVETEWGPVTVKIGLHKGQVVQLAPEYESCAELARNNNVPVKEVFRRARELGNTRIS